MIWYPLNCLILLFYYYSLLFFDLDLDIGPYPHDIPPLKYVQIHNGGPLVGSTEPKLLRTK